jgi:hypothetical protein
MTEMRPARVTGGKCGVRPLFAQRKPFVPQEYQPEKRSEEDTVDMADIQTRRVTKTWKCGQNNRTWVLAQ